MNINISKEEFCNPPEILKYFLDMDDSGIMFIDTDYNIIYMNKQKREANPNVKPGMKCFAAFEEYGMRCPFCIANDAIKTKQLQKNRYYVAIQKGQEQPVHMNITVSPVYNEDGEIIGTIEIAKNVEDLYQTNVRLERLNKEYEHVIYALSHDLRSPLVSIEGFLRKILKFLPEGNEQAMHCFERIRANVGMMNGLVKVLLDTSRIATGKLEIQDVDMDYLVQTVVRQFSHRIESAHADIKVKGLLGIHRCDRVRVQQVFSNLISNALDHCREKEGLLIEVGVDEDVFWVKDNGPGMPRDFIDKAFDAFTQASDTTTSGQHLGMGMSIVHKIIQKHGGYAWIDSNENGTCIYFTLSPAKKKRK